MRRSPRIIRDNRTLFEQYDILEAGDTICCRIRLKPGEEHLLVDLAERGIRAIPSFTSQICSRSKTFQTRLFAPLMVPGTTVIYTIHDLLNAIGNYGQAGIEKVVVKQEGKNGGLGIFLFKSIEEVYSQSALGVIPFPYVLQPFISDCRDLRVIVLGEYTETYERTNPNNFRNNLHCGGRPKPCALSDEQEALCQLIMQRGGFPYAHLDLMVTDDTTTHFIEVNLRGGLRGAQIGSREYEQRIEDIHSGLCENYNAT